MSESTTTSSNQSADANNTVEYVIPPYTKEDNESPSPYRSWLDKFIAANKDKHPYESYRFWQALNKSKNFMFKAKKESGLVESLPEKPHSQRYLKVAGQTVEYSLNEQEQKMIEPLQKQMRAIYNQAKARAKQQDEVKEKLKKLEAERRERAKQRRHEAKKEAEPKVPEPKAPEQVKA